MVTGSADLAIEQVEAGLAALARIDVTRLTDQEVLDLNVAVQRLRTRADAACVRAAGALDASGAWAPEGPKSPSAWLQWRCRIQRGRATTVLRCARALRAMPATEAALMTAEITVEHARLLVDAEQRAPDAFADDEVRLVQAATRLRFGQLQKVLTYWAHLHAPETAELGAQGAFERRELSASRTLDDVVVVDALLDPIGGTIFLRELERLEQVLWEADWAEARSRLGDIACEQDLGRTRRQRRADALRIMAERSAAKPADATEPRVLLHALVGEASLARMCELSNGQVVTPGQLVPVLGHADVERVVFDGPSKVIDVGVRRRLFAGATRTAVLVRDRGCTHPSCDTPLDRCEIDHIQPYEAGGETTQANGQCLCPFHNRRKGRRPPPAA
jgi:hypothetical protein